MQIDIDGLENEVLPQILKAAIKLEAALKKMENIDVPDDFVYYSAVKCLGAKIEDIGKEILKIRRWTDEKICEFKKTESNNKNLLNDFFGGIQIAGASLGNGLVMAPTKGVLSLAEALLDGAATLGGGMVWLCDQGCACFFSLIRLGKRSRIE